MFEGLLVIAVPSGPAAQILAIYCRVWGWVGDGQDTN